MMFKVFVVVIPKEGWARIFFWCCTDFSEFASADIIDYILEKSVLCQKKDGHSHARPSYVWHDNDKDLKVCFLVTCVIYAGLLPTSLHWIFSKFSGHVLQDWQILSCGWMLILLLVVSWPGTEIGKFNNSER